MFILRFITAISVTRSSLVYGISTLDLSNNRDHQHMKWYQYKLISTTQIRWTTTNISWSDTSGNTSKISQTVTWMIKIKHKYLLTTVNKEKDKSKHSHEMTQFWNRIALWSSLHKLVRISGSSHGSVFKLSMYRSTTSTNLDRVRVSYSWVQISPNWFKTSLQM